MEGRAHPLQFTCTLHGRRGRENWAPIYWSLSTTIHKSTTIRTLVSPNDAISASEPIGGPPPRSGLTGQIVGYTSFTFIVYLAIGLPLAILPAYVHLRMGFSAALAGLVISVQYIATFLSRPWAGHISDHAGAKIAVIWGMAMCAGSGALLVAAAWLHGTPWLSFVCLIGSRLALGVGESLGSTGATLWGISAVGQQNTAKVISFNGISTYGALALGAPFGVVLETHFGLASLGFLTAAVCGGSVLFAIGKRAVPVVAGEHLPFQSVLGRVAPHGIALALGGVGYSVLATFVTLFYASRHWQGAALCLTAFGITFIAARLLFIHTIERFGGYPVALACLSVESLGVLTLWLAHSPWVAMAAAAVTGFGFALVFPAVGVEAVRRVPEKNRGTALGVYTGFSDVSFFLVGPIAGTVIGAFGYASAFLFALLCVLVSLGIVAMLRRRNHVLAAL
ncbi:MFS transporter [Acidobacteria bacterium AB60]|nr:MFS transporter [Acidobacteria bacterium AB60]